MSQYPPEDPNQQPNYSQPANQSGDYGQYPGPPSYPPYADPNQPAQQGYTPYPDPSYQQPQYGQPPMPPTQYTPPGPPQYGQPQPYMPPPPYNPQSPYAPPPKKSNRTLWIVLGVIAAVVVLGCGGAVIAVTLAARSVGNNVVNTTATFEARTNATLTAQPTFGTVATPAPTTSSGSSSTPLPVPSGPRLVVGKTATVGDWQATVNSVTSNPGDGDFNVPKSGDTFLLVDVTVKNNSSTTQPVSSLLMFTLQDASGHSYDESFFNVSTPPPDTNLVAGGTVHGVFTYDVPLSLHSYTFNFQPDLIDQASATWDVKY